MDGKKNTIVLTREEVETAKMFGFTLHEYAKFKVEAQRIEREYFEWLQTPAGVAHMERQFRKLNRWRRNSRAYRARKRAEKAAANAK
jgi:hypothetical protein